MNGFDKDMLKRNIDVSNFQSMQDYEGYTPKKWYVIYGKKYLFKENGFLSYGFGEFVCSLLGQTLGFNCVNVYPARNGDKKGILIEDFNPKGLQVITLSSIINRFETVDFSNLNVYNCYYSVEMFMRNQQLFNEENVYFDKNLELEFKKLVMIDFLLAQVDRHGHNVEFLVEKDIFGKNILTLSPMFDNEMILGLTASTSQDDWVESANKCVPKLTIDNWRFCGGEECVHMVAKSVASAIYEDDELRNLYQEFKALDMKKFLTDADKIYGEGFSENAINLMSEVFEKRIEMVREYYDQISYFKDRESKDDVNIL